MSRSIPLAPLLIAGGPAALGAAAALARGPSALVAHAVAFPAVFIGVAALMIPALHIGASVIGAPPEPRALLRAAVRALRAAGVLLLGLAPAVAFLLATSERGPALRVVVGLAVAGGAAVALRVLFADVLARAPAGLRTRALFAGWSFVCVLLGARLLGMVLA